MYRHQKAGNKSTVQSHTSRHQIVALIPRRGSLVYKGLSLIGEVLICTSHAQPIFSCTAEVIQYAISQTQTVMASHSQQRSCPTDLVRILWFKVSC